MNSPTHPPRTAPNASSSDSAQHRRYASCFEADQELLVYLLDHEEHTAQAPCETIDFADHLVKQVDAVPATENTSSPASD